MIVHAFGGLANRLRVVLSYRAYIHNVDVVWYPDPEIASAHWSDVFEPLPGVRFLDGVPHDRALRTCDPCPEAPKGWRESYRELALKPELRAALDAIRTHKPYGAIHVRRTDHKDYIGPAGVPETTDSEFIDWINRGPHRIYLACDNAWSQDRMRDAISVAGSECITHDDVHATTAHRHTTLGHAAVDLFACAGACAFMGSRGSSFSDTIVMLRELGGWWS